MERLVMYFVIGLVAIAVAGPVVASTLQATVTPLLVVGAAFVAVRLIFYFTNRY